MRAYFVSDGGDALRLRADSSANKTVCAHCSHQLLFIISIDYSLHAIIYLLAICVMLFVIIFLRLIRILYDFLSYNVTFVFCFDSIFSYNECCLVGEKKMNI